MPGSPTTFTVQSLEVGSCKIQRSVLGDPRAFLFPPKSITHWNWHVIVTRFSLVWLKNGWGCIRGCQNFLPRHRCHSSFLSCLVCSANAAQARSPLTLCTAAASHWPPRRLRRAQLWMSSGEWNLEPKNDKQVGLTRDRVMVCSADTVEIRIWRHFRRRRK